MTELKKDGLIELDITDLNNLGNGVGRYGGQVVFVSGAVSGDRVSAKVIKVNKSFAVARLCEIISPSPYRTEEELCSAPLSCGGCVYRHITYERELELKHGYVCSAFAKAGLGHIEILPVLSSGRDRGYRNKAQYPVAKNKNGVYAGFYASKTHTVLPAEECSIQNEGFPPIVKFVCEYARTHNWSIYEEESGRGLLRHIYLRIGEVSGEIMLCLVLNGDRLPKEDAFIGAVTAEFKNIASLMVNKNTENTNVVLGKEYRCLYGKEGIEDRLCGLDFFISPDSFYQVNREGAELLYTKAAELADLKGDEILLDLYCGTGTIGLSMAHKVRRLCGVEIVKSAVECARENAARNGISNAEFLCADAGSRENILKAAGGVCPDAVIIDPPRKGSTKELVECLSELGVPKIVYISCNPDTLARDAAWFLEKGYSLGSVQPVDLFARTGHVECVVLFGREKVEQKDDTRLCDMHIHSNCSDGSFSPEELIAEAKKEGITAIALCDHNTVSGLTRFTNAAKDSQVIAVSGVEITSAYKGKEVHIVGLFLKENKYSAITEYLEQINTRKIENNQLLAKRLNEGGFGVDYAKVLNIAGDAIPNRVHFAKALMEKGYVSSVSEAFETILAEDGGFYKSAEKLDSLEVICFLRFVGAVPVLAHPFLNFAEAELYEFLPKAKKCGLMGMETVYPLFSKEEAALAEGLAREYGLASSGGSDFHGINKPDIKMGRGKDNITVPYRFYEDLKKCLIPYQSKS